MADLEEFLARDGGVVEGVVDEGAESGVLEDCGCDGG